MIFTQKDLDYINKAQESLFPDDEFTFHITNTYFESMESKSFHYCLTIDLDDEDEEVYWVARIENGYNNLSAKPEIKIDSKIPCSTIEKAVKELFKAETEHRLSLIFQKDAEESIPVDDFKFVQSIAIPAI
jgi:hypothetical protein